MKRHLLAATCVALTGATTVVRAQTSTNLTPALAAKYATDEERYSYAVGVMIAADMRRNLSRAGFETMPELVVEGFRAWFLTNSPLVSDVQAAGYFREHNKLVSERLGAKNKAEGEAYLAANKTKEGVVTLPSGLQYKIIKAGDGPKPTSTDTVTCHYRGTLINGTEFDSSYTKGEPANFAVTGVIKGWTEALLLMPVGSKWQLTIPSDLAYGPNGRPKIGPNSTLLFDIELIGIKESKPPTTVSATSQGATATASTQPVVTSDIIKVPSKAEMDKGAKIEVIKASDVERLQQEAAKKAAENKKAPGDKK